MRKQEGLIKLPIATVTVRIFSERLLQMLASTRRCEGTQRIYGAVFAGL
jgi:hypothetical protein